MTSEDVAPLDERIAEAFGARGYAVVPAFIPSDEAAGLARDLEQARARGALRPAGVGRGAGFRVAPEIRSDEVQWLDEASATPAQGRYLARMERLRLALNERLYLGLFGFEAHLAYYAPGAFYEAHVDRFRSAPLRAVSTSLYLNAGWGPADGGELRLYLGESSDAASIDVAPLAGTLVVFASERFLHAVLPASRARLSVTGWFTRRP